IGWWRSPEQGTFSKCQLVHRYRRSVRQYGSPMPEGRLYVCATPIGNLGDVSDRLREVLGSVGLVYAEDTRRAAKLLAHVGATPPIRSMFVGNEHTRAW